jgi:hypothetical protein
MKSDTQALVVNHPFGLRIACNLMRPPFRALAPEVIHLMTVDELGRWPACGMTLVACAGVK